MSANTNDYLKMYGEIEAESAMAAKCACVACNSCTCGCSCRTVSDWKDEEIEW